MGEKKSWKAGFKRPSTAVVVLLIAIGVMLQMDGQMDAFAYAGQQMPVQHSPVLEEGKCFISCRKIGRRAGTGGSRESSCERRRIQEPGQRLAR